MKHQLTASEFARFWEEHQPRATEDLTPAHRQNHIDDWDYTAEEYDAMVRVEIDRRRAKLARRFGLCPGCYGRLPARKHWCSECVSKPRSDRQPEASE